MQKYFKIDKTEEIYNQVVEELEKRDKWVEECKEFAKKYGETAIIYNMRNFLYFGAIINPINRNDWKIDNRGHAIPKRKTKKQKDLYNEWEKRNENFSYKDLYESVNYEFNFMGRNMGFYLDDDYFIYTVIVDDKYKQPKNAIEITASEYEKLSNKK